MAGDGTTFEINLGVEGIAGMTSAADAVDRLSAELEAAGAAATAAKDAVKAGESAYAATEAAADRAAKALEKINVAMAAQQKAIDLALIDGEVEIAEQLGKKMARLTERQSEATRAAEGAQSALLAEAAALDKLKASANAATGTQDNLKKSLAGAKDAATAANKAASAAAGSGDVGKLEGALGKLGGPLGRVGQQAFGAVDAFKKLGEAAGNTGPYIALAVAVVAATTAIAGAIAATAAWAIGLADANRADLLLAQGLAKSVAGGEALNDQMTQLENTLPVARDELMQMAKKLIDTGLKGDALAAALDNAAEKAAKAKFGPEWSKEMLTLSRQADRLKRNVTGLFSGLKIEKMLENLSKVVDLFDETSAVGKAVKVVFESVFQPLIDGLAEWVPKARTAFINFAILVMKGLIAIKPFGETIYEVGKYLVIFAGIVVGTLAAALAVATAAFVAFLALPKLAGMAFEWLGSKVMEAVNFLSSISLADIGTAMIDGLVAGLTAAGSAVLGAMTGIVGGAVDAAKNLLGIASPSKVFAEIGMNTGEGMAQGVEATTGTVQGSLESMVSPPEAQAAGGGGALAAGGGGNTYEINITAGSGAQAESIGAEVKRVLLEILEGDITQAGAAHA